MTVMMMITMIRMMIAMMMDVRQWSRMMITMTMKIIFHGCILDRRLR